MLKQIALFTVFGKVSLFMFVGTLALISFLAAAIIGMRIMKGAAIPLKWHLWAARTGVFLMLIHAVLAVAVFFL